AVQIKPYHRSSMTRLKITVLVKSIRPSTETITITREITNTIGGKVNLQQNHRIKVIVPQQFIGAAGPQAIVNVQYIAAIQWLIAQGIQLIANHDHSGYTFNSRIVFKLIIASEPSPPAG
ncbi:13342_t:CDS:2, partial [Ambispora leptoticha]